MTQAMEVDAEVNTLIRLCDNAIGKSEAKGGLLVAVSKKRAVRVSVLTTNSSFSYWISSESA